MPQILQKQQEKSPHPFIRSGTDLEGHFSLWAASRNGPIPLRPEPTSFATTLAVRFGTPKKGPDARHSSM